MIWSIWLCYTKSWVWKISTINHHIKSLSWSPKVCHPLLSSVSSPALLCSLLLSSIPCCSLLSSVVNEVCSRKLVVSIIQTSMGDGLTECIAQPVVFSNKIEVEGSPTAVRFSSLVIPCCSPLFPCSELWSGLNLGCRQQRPNRQQEMREYATEVPALHKMATRILSLTSSASGCERNWSGFEAVSSYLLSAFQKFFN